MTASQANLKQEAKPPKSEPHLRSVKVAIEGTGSDGGSDIVPIGSVKSRSGTKGIKNIPTVNDGLVQLPQITTRSLSRKYIGEILVEMGFINESQLEEALQCQQENAEKQVSDTGEETESRKLGDILRDLGHITEDQLFIALAKQLDIRYYEKLPIDDIDPSLVADIPMQFCKEHLIVPVAKDSLNITVAVADPLNIYPLDDLRLILASNINMIICPPRTIISTINRVFERSSDASQKALDELSVPEVGADEDLEESARDLLESSDDEKPIIRLVNSLLARAVKENASDIHIEPYENDIVVRLRIDGILRDAMRVPKRAHGSLVSRIKIIGRLNIAEKRIPQDGRIGIKVGGKDIDVRLSFLPTSQGERIVMRLLDKSGGAKRLDQMGLTDDMFDTWVQLVNQKHGIILVTGPTGSGKSTLLYASILQINTQDINILTIEDPVEYNLDGICQVEVKSKVGMTFGKGLRSILRQDPDVVMIGEIRDKETAQIAIQASMTGHLVLSTLHTNDTPSSVTRLMDFDIEPFKVASSLLGVMATRLMRRLCPACKQPYTPNSAELKIIGEERMKAAGVQKIYKEGPGCDICSGMRYSGRIAVHELLVLGNRLKEVIIETQDANAIRRVAHQQGLTSLRDSAMNKVVLGLTSIEEAVRATQTENIE
ncbi:MAG: type II secretion system ATPase GspE [Proteobacteria bacterium]|nr:type II secretion system ATPase GspE [Pseudomonadota bacterium]